MLNGEHFTTNQLPGLGLLVQKLQTSHKLHERIIQVEALDSPDDLFELEQNGIALELAHLEQIIEAGLERGEDLPGADDLRVVGVPVNVVG